MIFICVYVCKKKYLAGKDCTLVMVDFACTSEEIRLEDPVQLTEQWLYTNNQTMAMCTAFFMCTASMASAIYF